MSNINYIQETEIIQSFSQKPKKYWSYTYEITHIPTGLLYVGSRSRKSALKKFEDCYTDDYLGSSLKKEGPFSKKDTEINPQNYQKTILKVFYDEDAKKATKHEHGSNGLIMTYWNLYGKDKVLNQHCVLNDGSEVFSNAGQNYYANKTEDELAEIRQKQSDSAKKVHQNRTEKKLTAIRQKNSEANKGENNAMFGRNPLANKTEEELAIIRQKKSDSAKKYCTNQTPEQKAAISQKRKGENNGTKTMFQHPYDANFIGNGNKISNDIRKNYPNEKPWNKFTKKEREKFKII